MKSPLSAITPDRAVLAGLFATAAIYCRDLKYDFMLDDVQLVLMNQATASWHNLKIIFTTDVFFTPGPKVPINLVAMHYRPVFMLWLMLNQELFGSVLPWWHLTSLLLHLGVTFLVYELGVRMLKEPWPAAFAALLFALHPIHVESVSYVSASTDLLVTLFSLIAFLCYARFREEEGASPAYLAAATLAAALAMLSKETGAMFPWMLVAYEALRELPSGARRRWTQFAWTLPFFAVVAAYACVRTLLFGHNLGHTPGGNQLGALVDAPLVLLAYLRNLLLPFQLSFFYPVEWGTQWTFLKACGVAAILIIGALLWNHFRGRGEMQLQVLWTVILIAPPVLAVFAFVKEDWVHDRHMYIVSVPLFILIAALLAEVKIPGMASAAAALILVILAVLTAVQVPRFSDGISIFESALKVAPDNALAHRYLAFALCSYGRYEEAFREYRITEELRPKDPTSYGSYAEALGVVGRDDEAAEEYEKALRWSPDPTPYRAFLLYRLASIKVKQSDAEDGERYLREAIRIAPDAPSYHAILADALRRQGRTREADQQMLLEARVQKNLAQANSAP
jgi:protein O-mannosyl-transferase